MSRFRLAPLFATAALLAVVLPSTVAEAGRADDAVIASFEGGWIDLTAGWGEAAACTSDGRIAQCFRSEAEMDKSTGTASRAAIALTACSSSVRLYRSVSYGGAVLQLTTRGPVTSLSGYGFDNDTSSYKVGACAATFYDGASSGSAIYPGGTGANASATSMASGWNDRVGSVYIS
jgi:hypothetical protein